MPFEITNTLKAKSFVRIVGNTNTLITLSALARDATETVSNVSIAQASGVTDGVWRIYRGDNASGTLVLELPAFSHYQFYDFDCAVANASSSNVFVTNSGTSGTMILQLTKTATYSTDLGKL